MRALFLTALVFSLALTFSGASAQLLNTSLTITVRDETGNVVEGAEVKLFKSEQDYLKEQNIVAEGTSDAKGLVKLKKIEALSYYVIVRKDDKDNSGGGEVISKLKEGNFNKVTIVIQ